jgi:CLIP-associating protein 1/2
MAARDVRKTIVSFIVQHLGIRDSKDVDLAASTVSISTTSTDRQADPALNESVMSEQPLSQESAPLEPLYVHTQRELEDSFREMAPAFEGRETEHNWLARDKSVRKLRRQLKGNAPTDFQPAFIAGVKGMVDNILKVSNTLRTTMSTNGCQLVQELYRTLGTAMDPMTEIFIQNFIKMSAATKQITTKNSDSTMEAILSNCTYNHRLMHHIWLSFQEKNMQTRSLSPGWLTILMKKNATHKVHIEHSGGIEIMEKCLKKGLEDASPKVRESTRGSYWVFAQIWPDHGAKFLANLDDKMRTALEKDPNNPSKSSLASSVSSLASNKSKPALNTRTSAVRDAIVAQRRAAMARSLPDRPTSAQSILSTTEQPARSAAAATRAGAARPPSSLNVTSKAAQAPPTQRTLTSAPARRPRRPELNRPATADPYATRRVPTNQGTPTISPQTSPSKSATANKAASSTRAIGRTPVRPAAHSVSSTVRSKTRVENPPTKSSPIQHTSHIPTPQSSPSKDENLTLIAPFSRPPEDDHLPASHSRLPIHRKSTSRDSGATKASEEDTDGFTMVLPSFRPESGERPSPGRPTSSGSMSKVPLPKRSPIKLSAENVKPGSPRVAKTQTPSKVPAAHHNIADSLEQQQPSSVQVYEDPFQSDEPVSSSLPVKPVLEEIAINERNSDVEHETQNRELRSNEQNILGQRTPRGHSKTTSTGSILGVNGDSDNLQVSAETIRNRRLLTSAIERVRAKTLDAHGFRHVQELVRSNSDIWGEEGQKFGDLLIALLEYLEAPADALKVNGTPASSKIQNLKTQVLATIRAMLAIHKKEATQFYARSLCSVLLARRQFDEVSHITSEMEKLAEEIVRNGPNNESIVAILDLIESLTNHSTPSTPSSPPPANSTSTNNSRTITMSLSVLSSLLAPPSATQRAKATTVTTPTPLSPALTKRLGTTAVRLLEDSNPEVRRADLEFCLVLHERLGGENGEGFWRAVEGARESGLNLITYYLARRGKA